MKSLSTVYERAARRAQRGWIQRQFYGNKGGGCLVGVVLLELGGNARRDNTLPQEMARQIHDFLTRFPSYRPDPEQSPQTNIIAWNDAAGRRREAIVSVLRGLAYQSAKAEKAVLQAQNDQLEAELAELRAALTGNVDQELHQLTAGVPA